MKKSETTHGDVVDQGSAFTLTLEDAIKKFHLIPVRANKKPSIKSWKPYQTRKSSQEEIDRWAVIGNRTAWAAVTGESPGYFVLDFDGGPGLELLVSLGFMAHVKTPNGYHVYFAYPDVPIRTLSTKQKNSAPKEYAGLDVRGDGGYAICLGSNSSGEYQWLREPIFESFDDLPAKLRAFIVDDDEYRAGLAVPSALEQVADGAGRNDTGFGLACQLRDAGLDRDEAEERMREYVAAVPATSAKGEVDPYTTDEALKSLEQAYSRPPRNKRRKSPASNGERQADVILDLVKGSGAELFRESTGVHGEFVTVRIQDNPRTFSLSDPKIKHWVTKLFMDEHGSIPGRTSVEAALETLRMMASLGDATHDVWNRVAEAGDRIYLDLADAEDRVVEVTDAGWSVLVTPPPEVKLIRSPGTLALPIPVRGGTLDDIRPFLNVSDDDFLLAVAWVLSCFRPGISSPILLISGEQGSAKTTACRVLCSLVDPNAAPLRSLPQNERDLLISASNSMVLGFDNVSFLKPWISDALCRIATGAGFSTRALWTNAGEQIFAVRRPIILNGIEDGLITRSDLLDRSIVVFCQPIPEKLRKTESAFNSELDTARPRLLGALLDCVAVGLSNRHAPKPQRLPRMADFACWTVAAVPDKGKRFLEVYESGRATSSESVLEASPVVKFLVKTVETDGPYMGPAGQLLELLNGIADDVTKERKDWPRSPRRMAGILRRLAPDLRNSKILEIVSSGRRLYRISECERSLRKRHGSTSDPSANGSDAASAPTVTPQTDTSEGTQ